MARWSYQRAIFLWEDRKIEPQRSQRAQRKTSHCFVNSVSSVVKAFLIMYVAQLLPSYFNTCSSSGTCACRWLRASGDAECFDPAGPKPPTPPDAGGCEFV